MIKPASQRWRVNMDTDAKLDRILDKLGMNSSAITQPITYTRL